MALAASSKPAENELIATLAQAADAAEALFGDARRAVAEKVVRDGRANRATARQASSAPPTGLPGSPPMSRRSASLRPTRSGLSATGSFGEIEELLVRIGAGEYLAQIIGGIPMSQGEIVRLGDLGVTSAMVAARVDPFVEHLIVYGNTAPRRARLAELMREQPDATIGAAGLDDTLESIREEMRKFADGQVVPDAQGWHLRNEYIPLDVVTQMSELGVFWLTIPEDYGGMGLGKDRCAS